MWHFADDGDLYFEKAIKGFLSGLFRRWDEGKFQHTLSIIFFSRTVYTEKPRDGGEGLRRVGNKWVRDFYREVLHEETPAQWRSVLVLLKQAFSSYPSLMNWSPVSPNNNPQQQQKKKKKSLVDC